VPRYLATRAVTGRAPFLSGAAATTTAPLRLVDKPAPTPPGDEWITIRPRLSGICGSDLVTVTGRSPFYFTPLVSLPFTPGHEIVADTQTPVTLTDGTVLPAGSTVVLDPVLGCAARGVAPCAGCAAGHTSRCDRVTAGHLSPGLQTGACARTGGGWSRALVAHRSQVYPVPADLPDERAVLVEPLACAVHTALRARVGDGDRVLIVGAGSVGLFTLLALRAYTRAGPVMVVAKHRHQVDLARRFGADAIYPPASVVGGVRRSTRALTLEPDHGEPYLLGGVDIAIDCAGSASSLSTALRVTRAGGRVVLSGVPTGTVDLAPLWFRELELVGTYASSVGRSRSAGQPGDPVTDRPDFHRAMELAATAPLDGIVSATYPLDRWRDAVDHALAAGRLGAVKIAFDLRAS
jgi:threonine dehydrogenase-like Zn-dependent dehydrogenase